MKALEEVLAKKGEAKEQAFEGLNVLERLSTRTAAEVEESDA